MRQYLHKKLLISSNEKNGIANSNDKFKQDHVCGKLNKGNKHKFEVLVAVEGYLKKKYV